MRSRPRMIKWLQYFGKIQVAALFVSILIILIQSSTAFTNPPLELRKELQLSSISAQSRGLSRITSKAGIRIIAPIFRQLPTYYNGCEITSLAMLLSFEHIPVTLQTLAARVPRDPSPLVLDANGRIVSWGDPNRGFVGCITGASPGFAVYHEPLAALMKQFLPNDTLDLTGSSFKTILATVRSGRPVIVWTTVQLAPVNDWITWRTEDGPFRGTMSEHVVLLVGYDSSHVYVNNPLTGIVEQPVPLSQFEQSWIQMGRQAITVKRNV